MQQQNFQLVDFDHQHNSDSQLPVINGVITRNGETLEIEYSITDEHNSILWPQTIPGTPATRKDELWKHTCFELFIKPSAQESYLEFNFSPNSDWNCYRFSSYRTQMGTATGINSINSELPRRDTHTTTLIIEIPIIDTLQTSNWSIGISAVIEDNTHALHYYALTHCAEQPDFHLSDSFNLILNHDI